MTREGISESVAKKISGHRTDSVFKRYDIVSTQDIQDAARRIEAYHRKQEEKGKAIQFPYRKAQNEQSKFFTRSRAPLSQKRKEQGLTLNRLTP